MNAVKEKVVRHPAVLKKTLESALTCVLGDSSGARVSSSTVGIYSVFIRQDMPVAAGVRLARSS